jgi:CheY-like chemotaxis protein
MARQMKPRLILLDLHLPDVEGEQVLSRLRDDPATIDIPVVVLSADATRDRVAQLLSTGAADYLTKPFDLDHLLSVIDRHVGP